MVLLTDLLATPSLALRLLGGNADVAVGWVTTSELDDPTPFLEGGELLLTTGLRGPRDGWARWVERLVAAGACGVGFGVGLSHRTVPRTLTAAAATAGLALVEVPAPTPFIAVSRRLADLLRRSENEAEAVAARTQRDLAAAAAGPGGAPAVLRLTGRAVAGHAWLLDEEGTVLAASGSLAVPAPALAGLRRVRGQAARGSWTDVGAEAVLTLRPTGADGRRWLLVAAAPHAPRAVQATLGTAAALLGLLSGSGARTEGTVLACAVDLVVSGQVDLARRLADALQVRLPDPVVVVRWEGARPGGRLVGERHALLPEGADPGPGPVGVGRRVPLAQAPEGAREADLAFARTTPAHPVVRADGRSLPGLLDPQTLGAWAAGRLTALGSADDGADLRATLTAFLAHHGARQPAADALGVHRNTLRQRLLRCERLLGVALDSPTDRAELWLALTAAAGDGGR